MHVYLHMCGSSKNNLISTNWKDTPSTARNYTNLEEIREDLLRGVVEGALIDTYVVAERLDLFQDESLQIYKVNTHHICTFRYDWLQA